MLIHNFKAKATCLLPSPADGYNRYLTRSVNAAAMIYAKLRDRLLLVRTGASFPQNPSFCLPGIL